MYAVTWTSTSLLSVRPDYNNIIELHCWRHNKELERAIGLGNVFTRKGRMEFHPDSKIVSMCLFPTYYTNLGRVTTDRIRVHCGYFLFGIVTFELNKCAWYFRISSKVCVSILLKLILQFRVPHVFNIKEIVYNITWAMEWTNHFSYKNWGFILRSAINKH